MAEGSGGSGSFESPWIEKYRPEVLKDVVGNSEAVSRLQAIAEVGNLPNIILAGPPGIGKTTSILCLAHEMLGPAYKNAVLELNASDARGIDVVRNKIKAFAQKKVTLPPGRHKITQRLFKASPRDLTGSPNDAQIDLKRFHHFNKQTI